MASPGEPARVTITVTGRVQGVGFRWWVRARALERELVGSATNRPDGRVEIVAEGPRERCASLLAAVEGGQVEGGQHEGGQHSRPAPGRIEHVAHLWGAARGGLTGFQER